MTKLGQEEQNQNIKIGNIELKSKVAVAPMAGVTDTVFRQIIRLFSKECLLVTEMISSEALKYNKTNHITDIVECEHPISFQLSGHKPDLMAEAAKRLEEKADIIDINMGCPVAKIVKNTDGSKLMTEPKLASEIIERIKKAVNIPVTVKCRIGWDMNSKNHVEFAQMVQDSGADAIVVHGRTRSQLYSGKADWHAIGEVKQAVDIPVFGNGDITSPEKALECLKISGCDGVAIGRGLLGDPGLLHRVEHAVNTGEIIPPPTIIERLDLAILHGEKEVEYRSEFHGVKYCRKFFAWYIKGIRDATKYRYDLVRMDSFNDVKDYLTGIKEKGSGQLSTDAYK